MDKQHHQQQHQASKPKNNNNLFKMLPKAMSFGQGAPPFSPGRDFHHRHHNQTAATAAATRRAFFSGPIVRLVPDEARVKKSKNDDVFDEPTSPKVSCIGQIKLAKTKCSAVKKEAKKSTTASPPSGSRKPKTASSLSKEKAKGHVSRIKRLFSAGEKSPARKPLPSAAAADRRDPVESPAAAAPSLGQMKKFASSREAFAGFDWTAEMTREESPGDHRRRYYSDDETDGEYARDKERIIPYSAPIFLDGAEGLNLKPKKEVNIWKRRTMNPPRKLQIKAS